MTLLNRFAFFSRSSAKFASRRLENAKRLKYWRKTTMVLGVHIVLSMYGFWAPNDPRGSWSNYVGSRELFYVAGKATKVNTRQSLAHAPHNLKIRTEIRKTLKYPPVILNEKQISVMAQGFANITHPIYACAIMPQHIHIVLGRHSVHADETIEILKRTTEEQFKSENIFPNCETIWAEGFWQTFLNTKLAVSNAVRYVENNPIKDGLPPQHWRFTVKPPF